MEARTTTCAASGHPEFLLRCDSPLVPPDDVKVLVSFLENSVSSGTKYNPVETIQIGWIFAQVFDRGRGLLGIEEPDFQSVPIRWRDSVDRTLLHLRRQSDVAESVGLLPEIDFPPIGSSAIVCSRYATGRGFGMRRLPSQEPRDSGWFVGCLDATHDHDNPRRLSRLSLYQLVLNRPQAMPFIALPAGCAAIVDADEQLAILRGEDEAIEFGEGSYLAEMMRKHGRFVAPEL